MQEELTEYEKQKSQHKRVLVRNELQTCLRLTNGQNRSIGKRKQNSFPKSIQEIKCNENDKTAGGAKRSTRYCFL